MHSYHQCVMQTFIGVFDCIQDHVTRNHMGMPSAHFVEILLACQIVLLQVCYSMCAYLCLQTEQLALRLGKVKVKSRLLPVRRVERICGTRSALA